ncbi:hypothetical protein TWF281_011239 [Arthrobotrys megalospora]
MFATKFLSLLVLSAGLFSAQIYAAPLPQYDPDTCYINESGLTTCNRALQPSVPAPQTSDLLGTPDQISAGSESTFGGKFETVVNPDDFASKTHFKEGKSVLIEAQPAVAQPWQPY